MRRVIFEDTEAYFHGFFNTSNGEIVAIVEKLDGKMAYMCVPSIQFLDPPTKEDSLHLNKLRNTKYKPGDVENGTY